MSAGCVFIAEFETPGSKKKGSAGYLEYMDRPDSKNVDGYLEYMGNSEKSEGLFTSIKDKLTKEEKKQLKKQYAAAENKGSNLQKFIFTFETEWLIDNGLMTKEGIVRSELLMEYTRTSINALQASEGMENFIWAASVHYNTEHIHIHMSMVDPSPSWVEGDGRCFMYNGKLVQRGKIKQSSLDKAKETFVNLAISGKEHNNNINKIIREHIILDFKADEVLRTNKIVKEMFTELINKLPENRSMWKYKMNVLEPVRGDIDDITTWFIHNYYKKDFEELKDKLNGMEEKYAKSYGEAYVKGQFTENHINDLYYRFGNAILTECKKLSCINNPNLNNISTSKINAQNGVLSDLKYEVRGSLFDISKASQSLKKALKKNIESAKNQAIFEYNEKIAELESQHYGG